MQNWIDRSGSRLIATLLMVPALALVVPAQAASYSPEQYLSLTEALQEMQVQVSREFHAVQAQLDREIQEVLNRQIEAEVAGGAPVPDLLPREELAQQLREREQELQQLVTQADAEARTKGVVQRAQQEQRLVQEIRHCLAQLPAQERARRRVGWQLQQGLLEARREQLPVGDPSAARVLVRIMREQKRIAGYLEALRPGRPASLQAREAVLQRLWEQQMWNEEIRSHLQGQLHIAQRALKQGKIDSFAGTITAMILPLQLPSTEAQRPQRWLTGLRCPALDRWDAVTQVVGNNPNEGVRLLQEHREDLLRLFQPSGDQTESLSLLE